MPNITSIQVNFDDGSSQVISNVPAVAATVENVVVNESDGSSETLTPEAELPASEPAA